MRNRTQFNVWSWIAALSAIFLVQSFVAARKVAPMAAQRAEVAE